MTPGMQALYRAGVDFCSQHGLGVDAIKIYSVYEAEIAQGALPSTFTLEPGWLICEYDTAVPLECFVVVAPGLDAMRAEFGLGGFTGVVLASLQRRHFWTSLSAEAVQDHWEPQIRTDAEKGPCLHCGAEPGRHHAECTPFLFEVASGPLTQVKKVFDEATLALELGYFDDEVFEHLKYGRFEVLGWLSAAAYANKRINLVGAPIPALHSHERDYWWQVLEVY